jgi:hypothetical protein
MQNLSISCALVCLIILGSSALVGAFGVLKHQISAVLVTGVMYLLAGQSPTLFSKIQVWNSFKWGEQMDIAMLSVGSSVRKIWLLFYLGTRQHETCNQEGVCEGRPVKLTGYIWCMIETAELRMQSVEDRPYEYRPIWINRLDKHRIRYCSIEPKALLGRERPWRGGGIRILNWNRLDKG